MPLECELDMVTYIQRTEYGKGKSYFTVEKSGEHYLNQMIEVNITNDQSC